MREPLNTNSQSTIVTSSNGEISLYKSIRWIIITIFTIIYTLLMINVGIMSAATRTIKSSLNLNNETFGLLSSLNSTGRIIGTFLFMGIINFFNRKYIVLIPLYINSISVIAFTLSDVHIILYITRMLNGVCQVFGFIYFPMWIDQFGIQKRKTFMLTLIQLASPLGMVTGYAMNIYLGSENWRKGFWYEAIGEIIFLSLVLFVPGKYFSRHLFFKCHFDGFERLENGQSRVASIFYTPQKDPKEKAHSGSVGKNLLLILQNKIFIFSVLYKAMSQIICVGLGVWLTDYLENQLHVESKFLKFNTYVFVIVVGPMIGMSFGGFCGSLTGGYEKKRSVLLICVFHFISAIISLCVVFVDNIYFFNAIMVVFFIFNCAVVPVLTGLILWSMPKHLKGLGNGISSLVSTFLGKFPAPLIYGILQERYGSYYNKIGMFGLLSTSLLGVLFLVLTVIYRYRMDDEEKGKGLFEKKNELKETNKLEEAARNSINHEALATVFNGSNISEAIEINENYYYNNKEEGYAINDVSEEMEHKEI